MKKTQWNTITLGGDVPEEELKRMVGQSYDPIKFLIVFALKKWRWETLHEMNCEICK